MLMLANAWDAGTARLFESLGAPAIATTSAGIAWSLGFRDGDALPMALYLGALARITATVRVPVSADIEGGYSDDPVIVGENVRRLIDTGAVVINIEDGATPPAAFARKIAAARAAADAAGVALFINARTDVWLARMTPGREVAEVLARAPLYRDAGADGLFVPGATDAADIAQLVAEASMPINLLAWPGLSAAAELQRLGVRRFSAGSGITGAALGHAGRVAAAFLAGDSAGLFDGALAYGALNALMPSG
jgi:2-methylisocitrate lyase-like PEP mutase family enzyme